jgi:hypothetical protein
MYKTFVEEVPGSHVEAYHEEDRQTSQVQESAHGYASLFVTAGKRVELRQVGRDVLQWVW